MKFVFNPIVFMHSSLRDFRKLCLLISLVWLGACTPVSSVNPDQKADRLVQSRPLQSLSGNYANCSFDFIPSDPSDKSGLDASAINVLNWNIKKGSEANWSAELAQFSSEKDLVLIQEAIESMVVELDKGQQSFGSFAPGYKAGDKLTGVATFSRIAPINACQLIAHEPWLKTPKATSITQYAIAGSEETLLVVNIHMINFTLGHKNFRQQLNSATSLVGNHQGPVIISGDFNTWRPLRQKIISAEMSRLGLEPVSFSVDSRTRFLGQPVDHMYTRNLSVTEAKTYESVSSDHNPMTISLEVVI